MPAHLLEIDDAQVNHVTGIGPNRFYVALLNESARPVKTRVRFNPLVLPLDANRRYAARQWRDNQPGHPIEIPGSGEFTIENRSARLTALANRRRAGADPVSAKILRRHAAAARSAELRRGPGHVESGKASVLSLATG